MIKRTFLLSKPYYLSTRDQQLVITDKTTGEVIANEPIEDIGYVLIDHPQISVGSALMQRFAANNVAVVICDDKHHPTSMMLHLDTHYIQAERFREQIAATEPLKKQLWAQTIKSKILNQARCLESIGRKTMALKNFASRVKSGDTANMEGQASRVYWRALFGDDFRRDREGEMPNAALNYGYAIIRAAVARALVGAGLLPILGIHHHNKYNSFALADDIMEPYRPFVDRLVCAQIESFIEFVEITKESKAQFLSLLSSDTFMNDERSPMMIAMQTTAYSLAKCFGGESKKLSYPELIVE